MKRIRSVIDSDSDEGTGNDLDDIIRAHESGNSSPSNAEQQNDKDDENNENEDQNHLNTENAEIKSDDEKKAEESQPVKKRVGAKRIVLNTERLKGPKGVHTIEKLFNDFKFLGKGHEAQDLERVLKRMEYWGYRVYPKLSFGDFLGKVEQLGSKKDLQAHLKKYRLGMIDADFDNQLPEDVEDQINEEITENPEIATRQNELLAQIQNEKFDALFNKNDFNN